jgi:cell division septum initiation protein DivIVA
MMNTKVEWDQLVNALRDELQEKGGLIRLLNQQTETLYRSDLPENERLEEQIRVQLRIISRCTQSRELALRQTASRFHLNEDVQSVEVIQSFPEYVHPLLEALFSEVDRLSNRMQERLKQNQGLKERFLFETPSTVS